jgi:hypothetical protein
MPQFITGSKLNSEIELLFENAFEQILIISPYIKLHERYKSVLLEKVDDPKLKISVIFGKNEADISRSMKAQDFEFFKQFPNVEIRYEKRLHAKYYANDFTAILSSMNLYSFSQDNNIEAGVKIESSVIGSIANSIVSSNGTFDEQTSDYFEIVAKQAELLFQRKPIFDKNIIGIANKYKSSVIEVDKLTDFFGKEKDSRQSTSEIKKDFSEQKVEDKSNKMGFCIRTGKRIPFDLKSPFSTEAYKSWSVYKKEDYPEKYCHFSGEPSNGETSMAKPILKKNWSKAMAKNK